MIACEPAEVQQMGWGLSDEVSAAVDRAADLVVATVLELRGSSSPAAAARD